MNNNTINLVFVSGKEYFKYAIVTLYSAVDHSNSRFKAYFLYHDVDNEMKEECLHIFRNKNIEIIFIEFSSDKFSQYSIHNSNLSMATFAKFEIPYLIQEEKIIYLDSDMIVVSDLKTLWDRFDSRYSLMAVCNPPYSKWKDREIIGLEVDQKSFNAGVLFMNLEKIRNENSAKKLFEFTDKNHEIIKLADEAAFNYVYKNDWKKLPYYYNYTTLFYRRNYSIVGLSNEEYIDSIKNLTIIHFSGRDKPWSIISPHPMNKIWRKYYKKSIGPFAYKDLSMMNIIRKISRKVKFWLSFKKKPTMQDIKKAL